MGRNVPEVTVGKPIIPRKRCVDVGQASRMVPSWKLFLAALDSAAFLSRLIGLARGPEINSNSRGPDVSTPTSSRAKRGE